MKTILTLGLIVISSLAFSQKNKIPKSGTVKIYYPSEKGEKILKATGVNLENKRIGTWNFYTPDGKQDYTISYQEDTSSFLKKTYIGNIVISEENFINTKLNGIQTYYNSDGEKIFNYYYTDGKPDSSLIFDQKTGIVLFRFVYHPNLKIKTQEEYFPSGELKSIRSMNEKAIKDGPWIASRLNKDELRDGEIIHGKESCIYLDANYKEGRLHGLYKEYYHCRPKYIVEYNNGMRTGKGIHYFQDGTIQIEEYWSGKRISYMDIYDSCITYRTDGKIEMISYQKLVSKEGTEEAESDYKWFYPNGKVKEESQNINGQNHGIRKLYYENGVLHSEIPYVSGVINGKTTFWYNNGKKKLELMVENKTVVLQKGWDESGKVIPFESDKYRPLYESENHYGLFNYLDDNTPRPHPGSYFEKNNDGDFVMEEQPQHNESDNQAKNVTYEEYVTYDKHADFPGGWEKMQEFIQQTKRFPEAEKIFKKAIFPNIYFTITPNGSITDIKVSITGYGKELLPLFETEVKRIFSHMPLWNPAVLNGKNVSQKKDFILHF